MAKEEKTQNRIIDSEIRHCPYIATPSFWIIISAIACFLVGFLIWGFVGRVEIRVNAAIHTKDQQATIYVKKEKAQNVDPGDDVRVKDDIIFKIDSKEPMPIVATEHNIPTTIRLIAGIEVGDNVVIAHGKVNIPGPYDACCIITDNVCIFNSFAYGLLL